MSPSIMTFWSSSFCWSFSWVHGGFDGDHEEAFSIYDSDLFSSSSAAHGSLIFSFGSSFAFGPSMLSRWSLFCNTLPELWWRSLGSRGVVWICCASDLQWGWAAPLCGFGNGTGSWVEVVEIPSLDNLILGGDFNVPMVAMEVSGRYVRIYPLTYYFTHLVLD